MIAEVLNRDFVLSQLESSLQDLEQPSNRRGELPPVAAELTEGDLEAAKAELESALRRERAASSGPLASQPNGAARRSEHGASLDDVAFISNDPIVSLYQSTLDDYFESRHQEELDESNATGRRGSGSATFVPVTDRSLGLLDADRRLLGPFEDTDPRWVNCLFAMALRRARGRHGFKRTPSAPMTLDDSARLILVGDWGTGIPRAHRVASEIRKVIDEGVARGLQQHVIHLGDVYYSGWKEEYDKRFLSLWPVTSNDDARLIYSWSLNGNHDMYSGGDGYFDWLLADSRFARQERSSYFSLENQNWTVLGLDTAYEDQGLKAPQPEWVAQKTANSPGKVMLLSHHQLFSTDPSKNGSQLRLKLSDVIASGRIASWFWGHEHRCAVYQAHDSVAFASCLGHGGVPVYSHHNPSDRFDPPAKYEYFDYEQSLFERWALFGFAVVDLAGPKATVRYINEIGVKHHEESF